MVEAANRWFTGPVGDQVGPYAHDPDGPEQGDATAVAPLENGPDAGIVGPPSHRGGSALDGEVPDVVDRNRQHQKGFDHAPAKSRGNPLTQPHHQDGVYSPDTWDRNGMKQGLLGGFIGS